MAIQGSKYVLTQDPDDATGVLDSYIDELPTDTVMIFSEDVKYISFSSALEDGRRRLVYYLPMMTSRTMSEQLHCHVLAQGIKNDRLARGLCIRR